MIKSFFGLSISDTTASSSTATSSSTTTSENGEVKEDESKSNSSSNIQADESSVTTSKKPLSTATGSQLVTTKVSEPAIMESNTGISDAEGEDDEIDEESMKEAVQSYADEEKLAPFRTKQILKKVLKPLPPNEPDPSECCGSSCTPCVKDLWREEVRVWKIARGIDPYGVPSAAQKARYPDLDW